MIIRSDLTWELHTANHLISSECSVLCQQPSHLATESARRLIRLIDNSNYCFGNTDEQFIELGRKRKGKFLTVGGKVIANLEEGIAFMLQEKNDIPQSGTHDAKSYSQHQ